MKTAFIIIDVQNILVETGFETQKLLEKISYLQDQARKQQIEIIYIQHNFQLIHKNTKKNDVMSSPVRIK